MKILAFCDVDKDVAGHTYEDGYEDDIDQIICDFDREFGYLDQSGISLNECYEFDYSEEDTEYQGYVFRKGIGYVVSGRPVYNNALCKERLLKAMEKLPEEKYDVTKYKICKRNVITVYGKYEEVE